VLGHELESAFKLAVDAVNRESSDVQIRNDFSASIRDETDDPEKACKKAADYFSSNSKFVGVVGAYFSSCSIAFQNQLKAKNSQLPQISYRSPSVQLFDRTKYPGFYRLVSNNKRQAEVIVDIITHFRWNQASIIHTNDLYYGKELSDEIVTRSQLSNIYIKERIIYNPVENPFKFQEKLQVIKSSGSRINIIVAQGNDVFNIVKLIKSKNMYGEGWVWILTDGGTSLYLPDNADVNATAQGFIGVAPEMFKGPKYVNLVVQWYGSGYPGLIHKTMAAPIVSPYVGQIYRVVSLYHTLLTQLVKENKLDVNTDTATTHKLLQAKLLAMNQPEKKVNLILGDAVFFSDNVEDQPKFTVRNYINEEYKDVGTWQPGQLSLSSITWPGGVTQTPTDKGKPGKTLFQISFVVPMNTALGYLSEYGKELISAFNVAIDIINSNDNYQIELNGLIKDEGVDGIASCKKVGEELEDMSLVAVVGAFRSECTMQLHETLGATGVPIISYASTSQELSNVNKYPYFFRVAPSNKMQSQILRQIVNKYSLKEIGILTSTELSSLEVASNFKSLLLNDSIPVRIYEEFPQNSNIDVLRSKVEKIRVSGARVILLSALANDARLIQLIATELSMAGKGWIWFGSDGATSLNFGDRSDVAKALEGMLGVNPKKGEGSLYLKLLSSWAGKDKLKYPGIIHNTGSVSLPYTAQVFDAVNGIAIALTDLVSRKTISHQTNAATIRQLLYEKFRGYNSDENGYTSALGGKMYFDANHNGPLQHDVVNLVDGNWLTIGKYRSSKQTISFFKDPIFPGGTTLPLVGAGKIIYKVAAFFPKHRLLGPLSDLGLLWESALSAAVNWINRNDTIAVGFDVSYYDVGVDPNNCSQALKYLPANIDIVIGAARSVCTAAIYRVVHHLNIPMLTYASTSPVLSMKTIYPNLFRTCPSDSAQANAFSDLIEKYSWEKVGIIAADDMYGRELAADLENLLKIKAIKITTVQTFKSGANSMMKQVDNLKRSGSGVNIIIADPSDALQIYQEAFELEMIGKGWTWLGSDGAVSTIFTRAQNLQRAMQGMVGFKPEAGHGTLYDTLYYEWLRVNPAGGTNIAYIAQVFDSILVPAFALHKLQEKKEVTPMMSKATVRQKLLDQLKVMQTEEDGFDSTTGKRLYFDSHQDVLSAYDLVNLNGDNWVKVGLYEQTQLDITSNVVWPGGTVKFPPSDPPSEQPLEVEEHSSNSGTSKGLIVLAVVFSIFGLLVIIFMLYIVRRVRHRHLYMQSDLNQGGFFSVLYGHSVNRPGVRLQPESNGHCKTEITASATDITGPMLPRHV